MKRKRNLDPDAGKNHAKRPFEVFAEPNGVCKKTSRSSANTIEAARGLRKDSQGSSLDTGDRFDNQTSPRSSIQQHPKSNWGHCIISCCNAFVQGCERCASINYPLVLIGTIPNVLGWVRMVMDRHPISKFESVHEKPAAQRMHVVRTIRNEVAERIVREYKVFVWNPGDESMVKGQLRFWQNLCHFAVKLPSAGLALNIIEAMGRYPSSLLVHSGLNLLFGTKKKLGEAVIRTSTVTACLSLFDKFGGYDKNGINFWFDIDAFGRMQEIVIHFTAVSEYLLRCAYGAKQPSTGRVCAAEHFLRLAKRCIFKTIGGLKSLVFDSTDILDDMPDSSASICLIEAMKLARESFVGGTQALGRRIGKRKRKTQDRQRVSRSKLGRIPAEHLDALLESSYPHVRIIVGDGLDFDRFEAEVTRLLHAVSEVYEETGVSLRNAISSSGTEFDFEDKTGRNTAAPYRYRLTKVYDVDTQ